VCKFDNIPPARGERGNISRCQLSKKILKEGREKEENVKEEIKMIKGNLKLKGVKKTSNKGKKVKKGEGGVNFGILWEREKYPLWRGGGGIWFSDQYSMCTPGLRILKDNPLRP
jgi:hypothetical protein